MVLQFQKTFVINLEGDIDKWQNMQRECASVGLQCERYPGVDGSKMTTEKKKNLLTSWCQTICTDSMIGCGLSHMGIWKTVADRGLSSALILEDDVYFAPNFTHVMNKVQSELPEDWDILYFGSMILSSPNNDYNFFQKGLRLLLYPFLNKKSGIVTKHVFVPEFPLTTHCYAISNAGAHKLLKVFADGLNYHVDVQIASHAKNFNVYAVEPPIAFQKISIATSHNVGSKDNFPVSFNKVLDEIAFDERGGMPLSYTLTVANGQIGGLKLNGWLYLYFASGLVFSRWMPYGLLLMATLHGGEIKHLWQGSNAYRKQAFRYLVTFLVGLATPCALAYLVDK